MCIACTASCGEAFMNDRMLESSLSSDNFVVIVLLLFCGWSSSHPFSAFGSGMQKGHR